MILLLAGPSRIEVPSSAILLSRLTCPSTLESKADHCGDGFGLIRHLLGLGLRKRGAEDLGLVVFEAREFGLHVSKARFMLRRPWMMELVADLAAQTAGSPHGRWRLADCARSASQCLFCLAQDSPIAVEPGA